MSACPASPLCGRRILVAEDDRFIAGLVRDILLELGCAVVGPVSTLDAALRAIRTNTIDGALLDVHLGKASIFPAATELASSGIPFILMTGLGTLSTPAALPGNPPLLTKPFRVQQLEDMIDRTFRRRDKGQPEQV